MNISSQILPKHQQEYSPAVSIIVPVYNAEETLSRCIESVQKQTFKNYELLLIDDGSRDNSGVLCDQYASQDPRIRVIHKTNSGVSDSRNLAISQSRGRYLQFLDSDDWLVPEATEMLFYAADRNHCDMVIADFYRVIDDRLSRKGNIMEEGLLTKEEFAAYMMEKPADFYYGVLWNKLYRRDLVEKNHIRMNVDISWCEDFMFNLEYIRYTKDIYVLRSPIYYYVRTKNSLSNQVMNVSNILKMKTTVFEYYKRFYQDAFSVEDYEKCRLQVYRFFFAAARDGMVPPSILPNVVQLGEERVKLSRPMLSANGLLPDLYRQRKFMEQYLDFIATKHDISLEETLVLYCLDQCPFIQTQKEAADLTGLSYRKTNSAFLKLKQRGFLSWEKQVTPKKDSQKDSKKEKNVILNIHILKEAQSLLSDLHIMQTRYDSVCMANLDPEEIAIFKKVRNKITDNLNHTLTMIDTE